MAARPLTLLATRTGFRTRVRPATRAPDGYATASDSPPDSPPGCSRGCLRGGGSEAGATSVEVLAWTGVAVAALSILVQALTAGLGTLACQAAAAHALQATRVSGGTTGDGLDDAQNVLQQTAGRTLRDSRITVTRTPQTSTVTITATALPVLPALRIPLRTTTSGPTEPHLVQQP